MSHSQTKLSEMLGPMIEMMLPSQFTKIQSMYITECAKIIENLKNETSNSRERVQKLSTVLRRSKQTNEFSELAENLRNLSETIFDEMEATLLDGQSVKRITMANMHRKSLP